MEKNKENINISPEHLARLHKEERQIAWEEKREKNKPEWLKDRERAESIGRFVLFIFSPTAIIFYIAITILINIVLRILD